MREGDVEPRVGLQVVVDQHAARRGVRGDRLAEVLQARDGVEVEAEDHVGRLDGLPRAPLGVVLEDHHLVDAGHPVEEIGVFVRHDAQSPRGRASAAPRPRRATIRRHPRRDWCGRRPRSAAGAARAAPAAIRYAFSDNSMRYASLFRSLIRQRYEKTRRSQTARRNHASGVRPRQGSLSAAASAALSGGVPPRPKVRSRLSKNSGAGCRRRSLPVGSPEVGGMLAAPGAMPQASHFGARAVQT